MIVYGSRRKRKTGRGLFNSLINSLPFELHLPGGYQYCDPGINQLDVACRKHDIAYSHNRENIDGRHVADRVLTDKAWQRVIASDASVGEKVAAWAVTNAMKAKTSLGMGMMKTKKKRVGGKKKKRARGKNISGRRYDKTKKKNTGKLKSKRKREKSLKRKASLRKVVDAARTSIRPGWKTKDVVKSALEGARKEVKKAGGRKNIRKPRVLPIPTKIGGFLPFLIPLFAGLSAAGALAGGAAGIAKAVNNAKDPKQQLDEASRHNRQMEAIALGKGLYLKPYRSGMGLYINPWSKN